jgi:hypothetical protein
MSTDPRERSKLRRPRNGNTGLLPYFTPTGPISGYGPAGVSEHHLIQLAHPALSGSITRCRFDITLQGNDETVFLLI